MIYLYKNWQLIKALIKTMIIINMAVSKYMKNSGAIETLLI